MKSFQGTGLLYSKVVVLGIIFSVIHSCDGQIIPSTKVFEGPAPVTSLAYGNGTFVGVGGGFWSVSNNGSNWTTQADPPIINNGGVAFGNGVFLAFGTNIQSEANLILQSTNGTSWTTIYSPPTTLTAAVYGNNTWVFISTNGITVDSVVGNSNHWTQFLPPFAPTCITFGNGLFVIGAFSGDTYSIFSSTDGINWQFDSVLDAPVPSNYEQLFPALGIAYGNGVFVATGPIQYYGSSIYSSTNLQKWSIAGGDNNPNGLPQIVAFGGNEFFASLTYNTGNSTTSIGYTSYDGFSWTFGGQGYAFDTMIYGQGTFVGADTAGNICQSSVYAPQPTGPTTTLGFSTYSGVTINGTAGAVYQIQTTASLNSPWQTLTNIMLPYSPYLWFDTSSTVSGQKYYRSMQIQ